MNKTIKTIIAGIIIASIILGLIFVMSLVKT